ncbi:hypothetical protein [Arenibaculum sp.]|jgi:hypothetical protein|uniref:hypothetical protein n=1 Tax=Arenibaculum sp. TaxID=2865862 RepID=UPI002E13B25A|nr:hypothetical protein [Arenibaculum sp.]
MAECWAKDRRLPLPDGPGLDALILEVAREKEAAERALRPCGDDAVLAFLGTFARRHALAMPEPPALRLDLEVMGHWPLDLFERAARGIWEDFTERRLPTAGELKRYVARELRERMAERNRLHDFELSLRTRRKWQAGSAGLAAEPRPEPRTEPDRMLSRRAPRRFRPENPAQLALFA